MTIMSALTTSIRVVVEGSKARKNKKGLRIS